MKKKIRVKYALFAALLALFAALTFALQRVDMQTYRPKEYLSADTYEGADAQIGFSAINIAVHEKLGESALFYKITKLIGYASLLTAPCFALLGLSQLVRRKRLKRVDGDLWALLGHYVLLALCYIAFEKYAVNYRPVLIEGVLEASYPSSHTMMTVALLGAAMVQTKKRIRAHSLRAIVNLVLIAAMAAMAIGRLLSGVHWLTDVIAAVLIGLALVSLYDAVCTQIRRAQKKKSHRHRKGRAEA